MKPKPKRDDDEQSREFIKKAREIGADGDKSAAEKLMRWLAKTPEPRKTKSGKK